ncbi:MAG: DsbA family protein [Alphaproteobacteria bacterium]|nr:DsbA family protein [Alphaproteobacteria bacterium]
MIRTLRTAAVALAVLCTPALAGGFDDSQRQEIGEIVREYLIEHPEVLLEVSKALEERQQAAESEKREGALTAMAADVFRLEGDFVAGNPDGDVTMVEFFDYNCGWCKRGLPEVLSLVEQDKNIRLVLKEFPIFGADSEYAASAALASRKQGKYWQFHVAMLGHEGKVTRETVDEIAVAQGLDLARLKSDMEDPEIATLLKKNDELAGALSIRGTPAFVIDKEVIPGYLPKEGLLASINKVRDNGGCKLC